MNLIIKDNIESYNYKLIIGDSDNLPSSLSSDGLSLFNAFLAKDEDFKQISSIESTTFLVKSKDDREKMRAAGAKVRGVLDRKITEIAIHGNESFLYGGITVFLGALLVVLIPKLRGRKRFSEWQ